MPEELFSLKADHPVGHYPVIQHADLNITRVAVACFVVIVEFL